MENQITLTADTKEALNKLIDKKLKEGYLLSGGGMFKGDDDKLTQIMKLPCCIDPEMSLASGIKLVIFAAFYGFIIYYVF